MKNKNEYNGCNMNVRFWEPPQMLKSIEDISAELKAVNFRPAALPYNTRIMLLSMAERIHESLRSLVADLCYMSEDAEGDKQYNDAFLEAWKKSSILEVFIDANRDIIIAAPPLGNRLGGNAFFFHYLMEWALDPILEDDFFFLRHGACVIVKQYCHCAEVAMGTTENREIHAITDSVFRWLRMDDNMWNVDSCYVWCESDDPRTEIIITTRERVKEYIGFCTVNYENQQSTIANSIRTNMKGAQLRNYIDEAERILRAMGEAQEYENGLLTQTSCDSLTALVYAIKGIMIALREPYISGIENKYSLLYTERSHMRRGRRPNEIKNYTPFDAEHYRYKASANELKVYTYSPYSISASSGSTLCQEQAEIIEKAAAEYDQNNPLCVDRNDDIMVIIDRKVEKKVRQYADSDNMNTTFLRCYGSRVKVIYCRTIKMKTKPKSTDCVIRIRPASYDNFPH